jgi:microcystin-dependent protein
VAGPFLGEVKLMSFAFAPRGWAACNGQLLPINQNQALFSLLGTYYGGDGRTTFALPNLQGRTPIHGGLQSVGTSGGEQRHALTIAEGPAHAHVAQGTPTQADSSTADGNYLGVVKSLYTPPANLTALHPSSVGSVGGGQPHENMQPYLTLTFCIALQGDFPSRN